MTTIESNKLIAEFMGRVIPPQAKHGSMNFWKYHTSWDWLMPVVEKIETLFDDGIDVTIFTDGTTIENWRTGFVIARFTAGEIGFEKKIEHTYMAVVEFIKWYNKQ